MYKTSEGYKDMDALGEAVAEVAQGDDVSMLGTVFPPQALLESALDCKGGFPKDRNPFVDLVLIEREQFATVMRAQGDVSYVWKGVPPGKYVVTEYEIGDNVEHCIVKDEITIVAVEVEYEVSEDGGTTTMVEEVAVIRIGDELGWYFFDF